jgi:hypothetical protein
VLERPATAYLEELGTANACVITCLELAERYLVEGAVLLAKLDARIEIASQQGTRVTTIFSEKGLAHEGDGSSKDTAIYFSKPRTQLEAVGMIYRFLQEANIEVVGIKVVAAIEDGFLYEIIPTNGGDIWFKTKMNWEG